MGKKPGAEVQEEEVNHQEGEEGSSNESTESNESANEIDDSEVPENLKSYIKKLRSESAKYRTKAKNLEGQVGQMNERLGGLESGLRKALGMEDEKADPAKEVENLQAKLQRLEMQQAYGHVARLNNIPLDHDDVFQALLDRRANELGEGEELAEEDIKEIAEKVRKLAGIGGKSTGVSEKAPKASEGRGGITKEQFAKMTTTEKSALYSRDPELYNRLRVEAYGR